MTRLDPKTIVRLAAIAALIAAAVAALAAAAHHLPAPLSAKPAAQGLGAELERCQTEGEAALNDPTCQAAERRLQDHFFGRDAPGGQR